MNGEDRSGCAVAIIGAGPAGSACARALARAGIGPVCLVDGGPGAGAASVAIGETIPPDTRMLFDRLGLEGAFLREKHEPCLGSSSSWGVAALGYNDFLLNPHGHGWHLDRARFDAFLRRQACEAGAIPVEGFRLIDARETIGDRYRLRLVGKEGTERSLDARFVVDASGRASAFARRVGARQVPLDRLTFVYGFFDASAAVVHSRLTLLEAVENGWWYAAALPDACLAVAFAGDADHVRAGRLGGAAAWLRALRTTHHMASRVDGCRFIPGSLVPRVAASFLLSPTAGPRWLAIGDAAACFDPLSGQGIHKAIADGLDAAAAIVEASGRDSTLDAAFDAAAQARFDEYLVNRNHFYGLERRWPGSAFWRRRQERSELRAAA